MAKDYSLVFTKETGGAQYDTEAHGCVVLESMPVSNFEAKSVFEQDWPDENGVDVYDGGKTYLKATEMQIPMASIGENAAEVLSNYKALLTYLTTNGVLHTMASPWTGETLQGVRFVKTDAEAPVLVGATKSYMKFKLTVKVTKP